MWFEMRLAIKLALRFSRLIIVPSETTKRALLRLVRVSESKLRVVNWGLDHGTFGPKPSTVDDTRRVLYVGPLVPQKGANTLIQAFARVHQMVRNSRLLLGGSAVGDDGQQCWDLVRRLDLSDAVDFLGFIPESGLPRYYQRADAFVFVSRLGFGLAAFEAMASGVPTVVSNAFEAPEYVGDGAAVIPPDDAEALAAMLVRILTEPALAKSLRERGIHRAAQFSWDRAAKETLGVYREALDAAVP
jgi:glycosyltransferase involved in cell wall biosynthesis